ncbi:tetraacyldisaccharide 4'-kinase [Planctomycetales bacterium]|nr:tetraacyldisaccharide 4'-kinase [Planctomycetales bacterium]
MQRFYQIISGQERGTVAVLCRMLLWILSLFYGTAVAVRNFLFDCRFRKIRRLPIPIISVGNLTLGGTGKTPLVAWLVRHFLEQGHHPGIISRGYGSGSEGTNDEFQELAFLFPQTPHIQNRNRCAAAESFLAQRNADIFILDDAFQHRKLARSLDIVILDATVPFGYDYIFPRGTLRESVAGLRRAGIVLLSRADLVSEAERERIRQRVLQTAPQVIWGEIAQVPAKLVSVTKTVNALETITGKTALAFCGIGNPAAFRRTLERCGVTVKELRIFPDHHRYTASDLDRLEQDVAVIKPDVILCTMKDIVKIDRPLLFDKPVQAVTVETQWLRGKEYVLQRLSDLS